MIAVLLTLPNLEMPTSITDSLTLIITAKNIQRLTDTETTKGREPPCKRGVTSGLERLDIAF
jgi:hypothetical protein